MEQKICVHVYASGRVQGVNYRWFVLETAKELDLTGWVRNLSDGRVEAEIEGEQSIVDKLVKAMRTGPSLARVTDLDVTPQPYENRYTEFRVR